MKFGLNIFDKLIPYLGTILRNNRVSLHNVLVHEKTLSRDFDVIAVGSELHLFRKAIHSERNLFASSRENMEALSEAQLVIECRG